MNKEQGFLVALLAASLFVSLLLFLPFLQYILAAIIIAYILHPINERVRPRLGDRLAPLVVIPIATLVFFIPIGYVATVLLRDLRDLARGDIEMETVQVETRIEAATGLEVDLAEVARITGIEVQNVLFGNVTNFVSAGIKAALGFALLVFLTYYLLRDGPRFVDWLIDVAPMRDEVCVHLIDRINRTTWGVVVGHLFVAVVQGIVGGIGLYLAGISNVVFWTFVMILFSLLPVVGAFFIWAPAVLYLLAVGETGLGVFLLLYSLSIVSLVDNYVRPIVIDREAHLNPGLILVGLLGGIYLIGAIGMFIGPIVLAVAAATVGVFDEEYESLGDT